MHTDRGKGGKVTAAGWQVTLSDPLWHVISRTAVRWSFTNCYTPALLYFCFTDTYNLVCTDLL